MEQGHISRVELDTKMVISTTLRETQRVKNSSSSPMLMFDKRRSKVSRPLIICLILILMFLIFLICHTIILMLLMRL
jgi:hypothetical protein